MADIVKSLFGLTTPELKLQAENLQLERQKDFAKNISQGALRPGRTYAGAMLGQSIGQAFADKLFGLQDPRLAKAASIEKVLQNVQANLSPEDLQDPLKYNAAIAQQASQEGLTDVVDYAMSNMEQAKLTQAALAEKYAVANKNRQEALLKQQDYLREEEGRKALQTLQEVAKAEGRTPTTEEVISTLSPFMDAGKLAGLMQSSADKEAYRNVMLKQAEMSLEGKLEVLRMQGATQLQLKQMEINGRKEIEALKAQLNPSGGSKSSVYERGYANNFVTSAQELVPATTNLNILTNGGTSPVTAGVFTNLQNKGVLSATGAALGTAMTSTEAGQYESIMLPVIGNIATMQNAGRRYTTAQTDRLEKALIAKPGQPYIVQVQKMGELRQIAEAAADAAEVNPAMSDEQKAQIQGAIQRVRQAIPFTGADVAKFSGYAKKNPGVKFVDWLKVNGSDKEAFGAPAAQEKTIDGVTYVNDGKGWKKKQ